mgnify:CR=1 FL=1
MDHVSEHSIERMYDAYNAFNGRYEGIEVGDIVECNAMISQKAKAQRWKTEKLAKKLPAILSIINSKSESNKQNDEHLHKLAREILWH